MPLRLAINGFGRIGRQALKVALTKPNLTIVALNDLAPPQVLAHLLKYDSVYGTYEKEVKVETEEGGKTESQLSQKEHFRKEDGKLALVVGEERIFCLSQKDPQLLPWKQLAIDIVLECSGRFTENGAAKAHLLAGAKKVVVSAPTQGGEIKTFILGVNARAYRNEEIISNSSCTTNCLAPVAAVLQEKFGIKKAAMTTIHAYTAEQNLVDGPPPPLHEDLRRGRAAAQNIVPTTTGAAISTAQTLPSLQGLFDGMAIRVPVLCGSLSDFTLLLSRPVTVPEVNDAFIQAAGSDRYRGILAVSYEPLVSSDIIRNPASTILDLTLTKVIDGDLVKVIAWYDNEWGYANRLVEMAIKIGESLI